MSEDYKKIIEDIVNRIEIATGLNRGEIASKLGYTSTYISTALNRGGNKKLLAELNKKFADVLGKEEIKKPDQYDQALLNALLTDYIKFKASVTKQPAEDIAKEIYENTKLLLLELNARK